jgi:Zn-dependent alcohol dehydrogenase
VIAQLGPGVTGLKVGDHMISSSVNTCGQCRYCMTGRANLCEIGKTTPGTLRGGHLDEPITRRYRIEEAPEAFDDLAQGRYARGVIVFD